MSAAEETKTTTVFNGKQEDFEKYRLLLRGEFCAKGIEAALGPKFKEALPASEAASGQTAKQKEATKHNITGMGVLIKTNKSEEILVMIDSTVSEDWPFGRVDLVMEMLDKKFRPKDTMSKADQRQRLKGINIKGRQRSAQFQFEDRGSRIGIQQQVDHRGQNRNPTKRRGSEVWFNGHWRTEVTQKPGRRCHVRSYY